MDPKVRKVSRVVAAVLVMMVSLAGPASAKNHHDRGEPEHTEHSEQRDRVDLEDQNKGYTTEYFFSLSRGIMQSTMDPALKPAVLVLTVPLDIAFLPFAAIGGFLR